MARNRGDGPTGTVAAIVPEGPSTRETTPVSELLTQTEPKPTATPIGAVVPLTTPAGLFVRPLMRMTELVQWPPAAQTLRLPAARDAHGGPER